MINDKDNPVQWSLLLYELADAEEHLGSLIETMETKGSSDDIEFEIALGHIYSHLNRAWNSRNRTGEVDDELFEAESLFPSDIKPI